MTISQIIQHLQSSDQAPEAYHWGLTGLADNYWHAGELGSGPHLVLVVSTSLVCWRKSLGQFLSGSINLEPADQEKAVFFLVNGQKLIPVTEELLNQSAPFQDPVQDLMSVLTRA